MLQSVYLSEAQLSSHLLQEALREGSCGYDKPLLQCLALLALVTIFALEPHWAVSFRRART